MTFSRAKTLKKSLDDERNYLLSLHSHPLFCLQSRFQKDDSCTFKLHVKKKKVTVLFVNIKRNLTVKF